MLAERHLSSPYWRGPLARRAALREAAAREVATHGLARLSLPRLAAAAGMKFDIARHHYRTNAALLLDVVRHHHAALGERMADAVLDARALPGPARVTALATALIEALVAARTAHRATLAATAALPEVADAARHADAWLIDEFAAALAATGVTDGTTRTVLARSALLLINHWTLRLEDASPEERASCADVLARMVAAGT